MSMQPKNSNRTPATDRNRDEDRRREQEQQRESVVEETATERASGELEKKSRISSPRPPRKGDRDENENRRNGNASRAH